MAIVVDRETFLLFRAMAALYQLDEQCVFIELLIQSGLECRVHLHCRSEDVAAQFFMDELAHFQQSALIRVIRGFMNSFPRLWCRAKGTADSIRDFYFSLDALASFLETRRC